MLPDRGEVRTRQGDHDVRAHRKTYLPPNTVADKSMRMVNKTHRMGYGLTGGAGRCQWAFGVSRA